MYITNKNTHFSDTVINSAIKHAVIFSKKKKPEESCGAIISGKYVRFENKAEKKENTFLIDDEKFDIAYRNGDVQCVIHSHLNFNQASFMDQEQQIALDIPFCIINIVGGTVTHIVFWGGGLKLELLENRFFFYGVWDCFALVRDFFKIKYDVNIPNIPREFGFWHKGVSVFEKHLKSKSFKGKRIDLRDVQSNDVLLYNMHGTKYINHCAVLLDDGLVFHHFNNQISKPFPISHYQQFLNPYVYRVDGLK